MPSATLTALQARIDAYRAAIGSPRVARTQKSTATGMLETEFARLKCLRANLGMALHAD